MFCPSCGAQLSESAGRCTRCSTHLVRETAAYHTARRRYDELEARYLQGDMDEDAFQDAQADLAFEDSQGRFWLPGGQPGEMYLWTGEQWELLPVALVAASPSTQPGAPSSPSPQVAQEPPAPSPSPQPARQALEKKRRPLLRGCCLGTLIILLLVGLAGVYVSPLPQRWGLRQSPAETAFEPEPEREAALALENELEEAGVDTDGLYLYVLPYADGPGSVLYSVLDASQGFRFAQGGDRDAVLDMLIRLAESETARAEGIEQIAVDYRDADGKALIVLAAPTDAILQFAQGQMSREAFMEVLEGKVDIEGAIQEVGLP